MPLEFEFRGGHCRLAADGVHIDQHGKLLRNRAMLRESHTWKVYMAFLLLSGASLLAVAQGVLGYALGLGVLASPVLVPSAKEWRLRRKGYSYAERVPMADLDAVGFHQPERDSALPWVDEGVPFVEFQYYDEAAPHTVDGGRKVRQVLFHHRNLASAETNRAAAEVMDQVRAWTDEHDVRTRELE